MNYLEANPGRWGYLLSRFLGVVGLLSLFGAAALGVYLFLARPTADSLKEISAPGKTDVMLEQAGTYNFYYERMWKEMFRGRQLTVKSKRDGKEIAVNDNSSYPESSWRDPSGYIKFANFAIDEPGVYEISAGSNQKPPTIKRIYVGADYQPGFWPAWAALVGGIGLIIVGALLTSLIFSLRKRAVEAGGDRLVYAEKGISVYDNVIFLKKTYSVTELHKSQISYVQQTKKVVKSGKSWMAHVLQGIEINYHRAGRERTRIFWSKSYSTLYHAIKRAGYHTRWEPPGNF